MRREEVAEKSKSNKDIGHNIMTFEITVYSPVFPLHLRLIEQRMIVAGVMVIKVNLVC